MYELDTSRGNEEARVSLRSDTSKVEVNCATNVVKSSSAMISRIGNSKEDPVNARVHRERGTLFENRAIEI